LPRLFWYLDSYWCSRRNHFVWNWKLSGWFTAAIWHESFWSSFVFSFFGFVFPFFVFVFVYMYCYLPFDHHLPYRLRIYALIPSNLRISQNPCWRTLEGAMLIFVIRLILHTESSSTMDPRLIWHSNSLIFIFIFSFLSQVSDICWSSLHETIFLSATIDSRLLLWDLRDPKQPVQMFQSPLHQQHQAGKSKVKWNMNTREVFASACGESIEIWDARFGNESASSLTTTPSSTQTSSTTESFNTIIPPGAVNEFSVSFNFLVSNYHKFIWDWISGLALPPL